MESIYEINTNERKLIDLGRRMITMCEENKVFADNDELWNACVTAGNKLITVGTTYGMKSINDFSVIEKKALLEFTSLMPS